MQSTKVKQNHDKKVDYEGEENENLDEIKYKYHVSWSYDRL